MNVDYPPFQECIESLDWFVKFGQKKVFAERQSNSSACQSIAQKYDYRR
jgi:hypothetical protein